jgi:hypothetical protein
VNPKSVLWNLLPVLACGPGVVSAHEGQEFHLAGATLCVDSASVQVALNLPSRARTASSQMSMKCDLLKMLTTTLDRGGVAYEVRKRCEGVRDYTVLVADVRYLDPEHYVGFGEGAHNYSLSLDRQQPLAPVLELGYKVSYSLFLQAGTALLPSHHAYQEHLVRPLPSSPLLLLLHHGVFPMVDNLRFEPTVQRRHDVSLRRHVDKLSPVRQRAVPHLEMPRCCGLLKRGETCHVGTVKVSGVGKLSL